MAKITLSKQEKDLKKSAENKNIETTQQEGPTFAIPKQNFKLLLIGFGIIVLGFLLMIGGGSNDPNVFNEDGLFGFQRRTLAPVIVLAGFAFEIYAIMKKPKE